MSRVVVIGLAGGIGSGKSTVAAEFARLGATVLDADAMVHALLCEKPTVRKVVKRFGRDVLDAEGRVDRKKLGAAAFASMKSIRDLEALLHPEVIRRSKRCIAGLARRKKPGVVVIDAPLLMEAGMDRLCDEIVFVEAPKVQRLKRLKKTRGWGPEALRQREKRQKPLNVKRRNADTVVRNAGSRRTLRTQVRDVWQRVRQLLID
ncbi:MAG TPA: dephospho-CoA kinase [Planctomycetota bacterium]|nr:dephospho-CoA kinase [Planctomycetota bacterium]